MAPVEVTFALMKQSMLAGYVGAPDRAHNSTSLRVDEIITTLDGLTIGARNINYLTSGR
jgi:hypothetical protein